MKIKINQIKSVETLEKHGNQFFTQEQLIDIVSA